VGKTRFAHFEYLPAQPAADPEKLQSELRTLERLARDRTPTTD
jgi:hypothetical protein